MSKAFQDIFSTINSELEALTLSSCPKYRKFFIDELTFQSVGIDLAYNGNG